MPIDRGEITLRLVIHHPLEAGYVLAVSGGHKALGDWREPKEMVLGPERRLLNGGLGCCWEYTFAIARDSFYSVEYRYLIQNQKAGTAFWEREPNRYLDLARAEENPEGPFEIFDANFVGGMQFDPVPPSFFIGPYPQLPEHIDMMKASGVTAVLNLQTDEDIWQRSLDWEVLAAHYARLEIDCRRFPIRDFDEEDLVRKLPEAVRLLKGLVDEGRRVYVHCTAGMGRSPAVVVTYLSHYHGQAPDEALAYVQRYRPVICPNRNAIRRALQRGI